MGTTIRPEISKKNKYWINRHRFYELKHFCRQYPYWKHQYSSIDGLSRSVPRLEGFAETGGHADPTMRCMIAREHYLQCMKTVEQTALLADAELGEYLLEGVTRGYSYDILKARLNIPCSKETYYSLYRKFFWLLDDARERIAV